MRKSSVRTGEVFVMKMEEWAQVAVAKKSSGDGAPCAGKLACTVRSGGKTGNFYKGLPIAITSYADCTEFGWIYTWQK